MIVISSIIFPCMYVSLFVRDECERSVKNQASKGESVEFMTSLRVASKKFMRYRCSLFTLFSPLKKAIGRDGR